MPTYKYVGQKKEYFVDSTRFPKDVPIAVHFFIDTNIHKDLVKVADTPLFEPLLFSEMHSDTTGGIYEFKIAENVRDYDNPVIVEVKCYTEAVMYINSWTGKSVKLKSEIWSHQMPRLFINKLCFEWIGEGEIVVNVERSIMR